MRNKKRVFLVVVALFVLAIVVYLLFLRPKNTTVQYITVNVTKGTLTSNVTATGSVVATRLQNAGFKVQGRISEINVKQGDSVKAGQQLAKLDTTDLQNLLNKAWYNFNSAVYKRDQASSAPNADANAVKQAQQQVNLTWIDVQTAQNNLNNAVLTSQYDGVVAQVNSSVGDNVAGSGSTSTLTGQSAAVMVIVDPTSYQVQVSISESDITKIKIDQAVDVTFDALTGKNYTGTIASIDVLGTVSSNVVSYNAKVSLDQIDQLVKVNMGANATIILESKSDVLSVPIGAIKIVDSKKTVSVMKNGKPEVVTVETGISSDTNTEITSGLDQGDVVVVSTVTPKTGTLMQNPFNNRSTTSTSSSQ